MQDMIETIIIFLFFGVALYLKFVGKSRGAKSTTTFAQLKRSLSKPAKTLTEYDMLVQSQQVKESQQDFVAEPDLDHQTSLSEEGEVVCSIIEKKEPVLEEPSEEECDIDFLSTEDLEEGIILATILGPPRALKK